MAVAGTRVAHVPAGRVMAYAIAKIIPGLITFASIPVWLSLFGSTEYGRYSILWAVSTAAGALGVGWIRQSVLRGTGDARWSVASISAAVQASSVVLSAVPVLVAAAWLDRSPAFVLAAVALGVASSAYAVAQVQVQRLERTVLYASADSFRVALALLVSVLIPIGAVSGSTILLAANASAYAVATVALYAIVRRATSNRIPLRHSDNLRAMWDFGAPMAVWLTISFSLVYIDRLFVQVYNGSTTVGHYSAVADLVGRGIPMLAFPITMAIHPIVMRLWNSERRTEARHSTLRATQALGALIVVVAIIAALAAPLIFKILLPGVPVSRALLVALILGAALWQLALLVHKPLEFERRTGLMVLMIFVAACVTAILDFLLVPRFGPTAAALSFAAGAAVYCVATAFSGAKVSRTRTSAVPHTAAAAPASVEDSTS